jgi:multidrug efflux pump subunit AcrA (membrane-fusion protein)
LRADIGRIYRILVPRNRTGFAFMPALFSIKRRATGPWIAILVLSAISVVAIVTYSFWGPLVRSGLGRPESESTTRVHDAAHQNDDHHAHGAEADPNHIEVSPQAQRKIGLKTAPVSLRSFQRTVTIPGMIVERPGRTSVAVAAPLAGVVTDIAAVEGEAVAPGQKLFEVRLTHEEIVAAQGEFLKTVSELDVSEREVRRLEAIASEGIAGRTFLERKYEQEKQQGVLQAQREALLLHGLSAEQVDAIARDRKLLQGLTVYAPSAETSGAGDEEAIWQIQSLEVNAGQHVSAGETLAVLADYRTLFIQGTAFEQDTQEIQNALDQGWPASAVIEGGQADREELTGLKLVYTSGRVDPESRTFHFYVQLTNELLRDATTTEGHRFVDWRFKPGQRVELRVPVETWENCLVLPVGAVARDGVESYVFQANGDSFERRPVHEKFRDTAWVVVANDGSIFPGDYVAMSGAQQLQIALKNKSGGAVDPHAGHNH